MENNKCFVKLIPFVLYALLFIACKNEGAKSVAVHDPSCPVEITGFDPKEGGVRTRLYIHGKNFGSNVNDINVKIGGKLSKIIGSNGETLYCMVPFKAFEGSIEVTVGENGTPITATEKFKYVPTTIVGTVAGRIDETGKNEIKDGAFEEAGFGGPSWLCVDPKNQNIVYAIDGGQTGGTAIRELDLSKKEVSTLLTLGQGNWVKLRCINFSTSGDTAFVVNEQTSQGAIGVSYMTRQNGFKRPQPLIKEKEVFTVAAHPNGELYYNTRTTGGLYRYDIKTGVSNYLYAVGGKSSAYFITMHPTGNYAYINFATYSIILKAEYDWENKTLKNYNVICGKQQQKGWVDGQGANARLMNPYQGVFVKNEQYVKEGKEDVYDYYFADSQAHCIRVLTPEGFVYTYAGRGSQGVNQNPDGYVDGDLRREARFKNPLGLHFDEENKILYVGDAGNFRIRDIKKDE